MVWNLATNGLRAMPQGGALWLAVERGASTADGPGHVGIAVRDEGVGIAPDQLESILQPFRSDFARGTGLGLSIVHRIVNDYGGELRVTSDEGRGTTVTVKLPGAPEPAVAEATAH